MSEKAEFAGPRGAELLGVGTRLPWSRSRHKTTKVALLMVGLRWGKNVLGNKAGKYPDVSLC